MAAATAPVPAAQSAFVGTHAIFDPQERVVAYELLFRSSLRNEAIFSDPDAACAETILTSITDVGLDGLLGDAKGFINVSEGILFGPSLDCLPPDRIVLEVLESVSARPEVVKRLEALRAAGFRLALDDFDPRLPQAQLLPLADIVKVDIRASGLTESLAWWTR